MADKYEHWLPKLMAWFRRGKGYAITLGQTAYYSLSKDEVYTNPRWIRHENHHKLQWRRDGRIKFAVKYIYYQIRYGYANNPYEIEAREVANNPSRYSDNPKYC